MRDHQVRKMGVPCRVWKREHRRQQQQEWYYEQQGYWESTDPGKNHPPLICSRWIPLVQRFLIQARTHLCLTFQGCHCPNQIVRSFEFKDLYVTCFKDQFVVRAERFRTQLAFTVAEENIIRSLNRRFSLATFSG